MRRPDIAEAGYAGSDEGDAETLHGHLGELRPRDCLIGSKRPVGVAVGYGGGLGGRDPVGVEPRLVTDVRPAVGCRHGRQPQRSHKGEEERQKYNDSSFVTETNRSAPFWSVGRDASLVYQNHVTQLPAAQTRPQPPSNMSQRALERTCATSPLVATAHGSHLPSSKTR
ncbi:MAG: hypothetical protein BWY79_01993 [Actinobacteria bacterium ADurb.Bin444]|nr:MAG: hypothetical protein BWY79_01993 [Actinobacteria bacterium ADurb.Bin444]